MKGLKSILFRDVEVKHSWLYWTFFIISLPFLLYGMFYVFKQFTMETERTFAIITSDYRSKRSNRREFTYAYQVDGKQYVGKIMYSGESIASVGDTCYVIYEVRNKENARVVRRHCWGYVDNPAVVKRK